MYQGVLSKSILVLLTSVLILVTSTVTCDDDSSGTAVVGDGKEHEGGINVIVPLVEGELSGIDPYYVVDQVPFFVEPPHSVDVLLKVFNHEDRFQLCMFSIVTVDNLNESVFSNINRTWTLGPNEEKEEICVVPFPSVTGNYTMTLDVFYLGSEPYAEKILFEHNFIVHDRIAWLADRVNRYKAFIIACLVIFAIALLYIWYVENYGK